MSGTTSAAAGWTWMWLWFRSWNPEIMAAAAVTLALLTYVCGMWRFDRFSSRDLPRIPTTPFFGNMGPFVLRKRSFTELIQAQYRALRNRPFGGVFCFFRPAFLLRDPRLVRRVLQTNAFDFRRRRPLPGALPRHPLLDHDLDLMTGSCWKQTRSNLEMALDLEELEPAMEEVLACARRLAVRLERLCHNQAVRVELLEPAKRFFSDACARTLLGHAADALRTPRDAFHTHCMQLVAPPAMVHRLARLCSAVYPQAHQNMNLPMVLPSTEAYFRNLGRTAAADVRSEVLLENMEKKNDSDSNVVKRKNISSNTLGADPPLEENAVTDFQINEDEKPLHVKSVQEERGQNSDKEDKNEDENIESEWRRSSALHQMLRFQITSEAQDDAKLDETSDALVGVAAESVRRCTQLLASSLHLLSCHPEAQLRAAQEAAAAQKVHGGLSVQALKVMTYLDCVLKETLRLHPPVPLVHRTCERRGSVLGTGAGPPVPLQTGDDLWIPVCGLHRDSQYWVEPTFFRPERFLERQHEHLFTFVPFGAGPRACVGKELALELTKMALATLLPRLDFRPSNSKLKQAKWSYLSEFTGGVWATVQKRDPTQVHGERNTL